jgi:hypothetical protein
MEENINTYGVICVHLHSLIPDYFLLYNYIVLQMNSEYSLKFMPTLVAVFGKLWARVNIEKETKNYYYYFGGTRVWTQAFTLASQVLYHLGHAPSSKPKILARNTRKSVLGCSSVMSFIGKKQVRAEAP